MGGNSHNCTCTIACEHIVAHIYRDILSGERIDRVAAGEYTRHLLVDHTLAFGLMLYRIKISLYSLSLIRSGDLSHILALRRKHHECHTEHSVGARGEDIKHHIAA